MIKFRGNSNGKEVLGMALSEMNIKKLKEGMPILVNDPTFYEGKILIMYGRTEEEIIKELKSVMTINDDTRISLEEECKRMNKIAKKLIKENKFAEESVKARESADRVSSLYMQELAEKRPGSSNRYLDKVYQG